MIVLVTKDGSNTILNTDLQETYHSVHGAIRESVHIFINHGLRTVALQKPNPRLSILEIGFGTGLNALLSLLEANRRSLDVTYESWEKFPLPETLWRQLNYGEMLGDQSAYIQINQAPWNVRTKLGSHFELCKRQGDVVSDPVEGAFDLIYYDAFAPSRQPEMWTYELLRKVSQTLNPGGILVTYCAKGQVKRDLAAMGLTVETLEGPPGKKEMTRASRSQG